MNTEYIYFMYHVDVKGKDVYGIMSWSTKEKLQTDIRVQGINFQHVRLYFSHYLHHKL